jgi:hypothetical protein
MTENMDPDTARWVSQETERLVNEGKTPGSPEERDLIKQCRRNRPKMYRRLRAAGMLEKMAFVLYEKMHQSTRVYVLGGLPYPDAQEEATRDWLLLGPEDDTNGY